MASSSFTSTARITPSLSYEPPVYCWSGLKSPICVARESGRRFFGCQRWKEGGCKYFAWKDENGIEQGQNPELLTSGAEKMLFQDLKYIVCDMRRELTGRRVEVSDLKTIVQTQMEDMKKLIEMEESKKFEFLWKLVGLVVIGVSMIIYVPNEKNSVVVV
ncbi:unnamed protein product [Cuscuta epithymum]|uniref:Zinc finger GRF-type domain-containing protein n=1 Tax=Cuscuta epithymum TaxID=186058 RepID=A0AAV0DRD2_9ASTE|nr:unnamed protein product [Cuscuta epithymum]